MSIVWMTNALRLPQLFRPGLRPQRIAAVSNGIALAATEFSDAAAARFNRARTNFEVTQFEEFIRAGGQVTVRR
jgi:hypothetical protein